MFCPACDTRHPSTANFCMNCGIPLRESAAAQRADGQADAAPAERNWEYQELEIPLNFSSLNLSDEQVVERYRDVVSERLALAARAGWEPDQAADFQTLWTEGKIKWRADDTLNPTCAFDTVTIRLKRALP